MCHITLLTMYNSCVTMRPQTCMMEVGALNLEGCEKKLNMIKIKHLQFASFVRNQQPRVEM